MKATTIIFVFMAIITGPIDMAMWRRWLLFCVDKDKPKFSYFSNCDSGSANVGGKYPQYTSGFV
jgi:hypothetical protein